MREIRFRGKGISAHKGEWIYGFFKKNTHGDCYIENEYGLAIAVDPETVSQLACISAKSGEIYEGDYLEDDEGDVKEAPCKTLPLNGLPPDCQRHGSAYPPACHGFR